MLYMPMRPNKAETPFRGCRCPGSRGCVRTYTLVMATPRLTSVRGLLCLLFTSTAQSQCKVKIRRFFRDQIRSDPTLGSLAKERLVTGSLGLSPSFFHASSSTAEHAKQAIKLTFEEYKINDLEAALPNNLCKLATIHPEYETKSSFHNHLGQLLTGASRVPSRKQNRCYI